MDISPLAPARFPDLPEITGVTFATAAAGIKYKDRTDVLLALLAPGTSVAGVFTRSATRSAPVLDCQAKLGSDPGGAAAILVNSGNSNAFTGGRGVTSVAAICQAVCDETGVAVDRVFTASTGVIGEPLPHDRIVAKIAELHANQAADAIEKAARAIMTTDTFAKGAAATVDVAGKPVKIAGIAKGSGMIAPDMATMLVYIFTDAKIGQSDLQKIVSALNAKTFNCITVDSDTSTSDSLLMAATGASGVDVTGHDGFVEALHGVMQDLAHQVVRDGEGATKFVTVKVEGARSDDDAHKVALSIANSPLVKTAIAGEDANWGRVVMAVGKSGAAADRDRLSIRFGDITVAENGWRAPNYSEEATSAYMKNAELEIGVDLGIGDGTSTVWTCDLTHGYISINADYRS
ncbi:MAG: bifunctional glutamate N-acetyltransferase/amino-acid acetyltransferase ArgJ [Yoonia sp.]|uniref:bifunctional glutamate N-acetyltransferase/amino-acid acetyltransferase ArgJ n=1 Tax=Yoonia sp. TaxID=2212373 RepID=UPI00273DB895|nr:bifunctional glutamate N-acetyltransferase/amino-acid acetyltransferase ArgJ [Yoonia sp.]MDP5086761.1 bifunctional glutamate N-acetyltransferase/amino-acid acetyltransferase ArgJ [Yoonia sp.]